jgi:hypothetical protein
MRPGTTLGAIVLLLMSGCGSDAAKDSQTERGEEYVDALVTASGLTDEEVPNNLQEDFRCVMEGWIDIIGLDALDEADVTPEEFAEAEDFATAGLEVSDDQARDAVDAFFGCTDLVELYVLSESTEEERDCARNALEDQEGELRETMKEDLLGRTDTDLSTAVDDVLIAECDISIYAD